MNCPGPAKLGGAAEGTNRPWLTQLGGGAVDANRPWLAQLGGVAEDANCPRLAQLGGVAEGVGAILQGSIARRQRGALLSARTGKFQLLPARSSGCGKGTHVEKGLTLSHDQTGGNDASAWGRGRGVLSRCTSLFKTPDSDRVCAVLLRLRQPGSLPNGGRP